MIKIVKFAVVATVSLIAVQSVTAMAQAEKHAINNKGTGSNNGKTRFSDLSFWSASNAKPLHIDSADFTPAKGEAFSVCSSSTCDSSNGNALQKPATAAASSSSSGTVVIHAPADMKCVQGVHFPQATLTLRQGALELHDAVVTACDASSFSLSYQDMLSSGTTDPQLMSICTTPNPPASCKRGIVEAAEAPKDPR